MDSYFDCHLKDTEEIESEGLTGPEDAADVAESRRAQREQDERDELARRSTVLKVKGMSNVDHAESCPC